MRSSAEDRHEGESLPPSHVVETSAMLVFLLCYYTPYFSQVETLKPRRDSITGMKNAVIVHGRPTKEIYYSDEYPSSSNFAWIPWLQKQLIINDIKTDTPEMPLAFEPNYDVWKKELERFDIGQDTILVGHSAGGGFLLKWLAQNADARVQKLILVAPSIDPYNKSTTGFCRFELSDEVANQVQEIHLLVSDEDSEGVMKSIKIIRETIPTVRVHEFKGYGHFIPAHMGKSAFPELVKIILN